MIDEVGWDFNPDICPADQHLIEVLSMVTGGNMFHFGTGNHHKVGLELRNFEVLGLCGSVQEMNTYMELCKINPSLNLRYQCMYGDIHYIIPALLPRDLYVATLFHLGEMSPVNPLGWSYEDIIATMMTKVIRLGAWLVVYKGSFGFPQIEPLLQRYTIDREYKSLRMYRRTV